jgi:LacI family transcriptional regulator
MLECLAIVCGNRLPVYLLYPKALRIMSKIHDVAARAGVSTSTVSHVINQTRFVSEDTRERVLQAIAELNYQPNRLARSLRNRQTHTLGVLLPNSANPFFAEVLLGIEAACYNLHYNVILGNAHDDPKRELSHLEVLLAKQVDGVLLVSSGAYEAGLEIIQQNNTAVVMIDRVGGAREVDTILVDNEQGGLLATHHLLALGHRHIGCIAGPSLYSPSHGRLVGYQNALREQNIPSEEQLIVTGDFQHEGGYNGCRALFSLSQPPSALFVCNDLMAVGALFALHEMGLRVPQDVSVVGFDDIPLASYTIPALTTIMQPGRELGQLAVETLVKRIRRPDIPASHQLLPVRLIERASSAPLRG